MTTVAKAWIHDIYADRDDPNCPGRYFLLCVYPDTDQLVKAGERYCRHRGSSQDLSDSAGLFQPVGVRSRYDERQHRWIDTSGPFIGVMRLAVGWLTGEIVAHESTHAALAVWRMHRWSQTVSDTDVNLGDDCDHAEERFAHLLGAIAGEVANVVHRVSESLAAS